MQDNIPVLFQNFLKSNGYKVSLDRLKLEMQAHPEYPSLNSLDDVLDVLNIKHLITRLPWAKAKQIKNPFLLIHTADEDHKGIHLITKLDSNSFEQLDLLLSHTKKSIDEMKDSELCTCIVVEANEHPYWDLKQEIRRYSKFLPFALILIIGFLSNIWIAPLLSFYLLTCLVALYVASLILQVEEGGSSDFINYLCGSDTSGCNHVLNSKQSYITPYLKLSDLIITYFITLSVFIFISRPESISSTLSLSAIAAVPFSLYSIVVQYKMKQWCKLCMIINLLIVILVFQVILFGVDFYPVPFELIRILSLGIVIGLSWLVLRDKLRVLFNEEGIMHDLIYFRRSTYAFKGFIHFQNALKPPPNFELFPEMYNPKGLWHLTLVLRPSCPSCRDMWNMIMELNRELHCFEVIKVLFSIKDTSEKSNEIEFASSVLNLYNNSAEENWIELIDSWFRNNEVRKSERKLDSTKIEDSMYELIHKWAQGNTLPKTPIVLLNGKPMPYLYRVIELKILLKNLYAEAIQEAQIQDEEVNSI